MTLDASVVQNELKAMIKLCSENHRNLVHVLDTDRLPDRNHAFIDMDLCDITLKDYHYAIWTVRTDESKGRRANDVWKISMDIGSGLEFIHTHNFINRDLKPQNGISQRSYNLNSIIVVYSKRDDAWKISDFGLSSECSSNSHNKTTAARGTSGYRAPEILLDRDVRVYSYKVHIWALGCIIFELATGKVAFPNDVAVREYYFSKAPFKVSLDSAFRKETISATSNLIRTMLHRDEFSRPSATEMAPRTEHNRTEHI